MRPRTSIRLLWLLFGLLSIGSAEARTLTQPAQATAFEVPDAWQSLPAPPNTEALARTADGQRFCSFLVAALPKGQVLDPKAFSAGARKSIEESGQVIIGEGTVNVGSLVFFTIRVAKAGAAQPYLYMCTTFANDKSHSLVLGSEAVDPSQDPELTAVLQSFRFTSPPKPMRLSTDAYRFGYKVGQMLPVLLPAILAVVVIFGGIVAVIVFLILRSRRQARRSVPPPVFPLSK